MSYALPNMDDQITKPMITDALQERALSLSVQRLLSFVDRVELAGITELLFKGVITRRTVWNLLLRFHFIPEERAEFAPKSLPSADLIEVWMRLDSLASNVMPDLTEADRGEQAAPRWFTDAMHLVGQELRTGHLTDGDAVSEYVPDQLVDGIHRSKVIEKYGSSMSIGYSLDALGVGFGRDGQSIWVADALAQALLFSVNVYDEAMNPMSDESKIELGRIRLWWNFLKGFTCSLAHRSDGYPTLPVLVDNPEVFERIKLALTTGLDRLLSAKTSTIPSWVGIGGDIVDKVQAISVPELIELLDQRLAIIAEEQTHS